MSAKFFGTLIYFSAIIVLFVVGSKRYRFLSEKNIVEPMLIKNTCRSSGEIAGELVVVHKNREFKYKRVCRYLDKYFPGNKIKGFINNDISPGLFMPYAKKNSKYGPIFAGVIFTIFYIYYLFKQ